MAAAVGPMPVATRITGVPTSVPNDLPPDGIYIVVEFEHVCVRRSTYTAAALMNDVFTANEAPSTME